MPFSPYLNFNGNTKEALTLYKKAFDAGEPEIMLYKDMPPNEENPVLDELKDLVMHAELKIKDTWFMFSDAPGMESNFGNGLTLLYASKDQAELKKAFEVLRENGKVEMELQETFWSKSYGSLVDKFGVGWQFNLNNE